MAATWTSYGRSKLLAALITPDIFTSLGPLQLALTRDAPVANASPSQLVEPVAGGYGRADYTAGAAYWDITGFGELANSGTITFPTVTSSWGLMMGWALVVPADDACLVVGTIDDPFVADVGMVPTVYPGALLLGSYDT